MPMTGGYELPNGWVLRLRGGNDQINEKDRIELGLCEVCPSRMGDKMMNQGKII